ncbi:hypothetical protein OIO90_004727 [Microbotryomycetes sp. JL221]|nr:hypothetical protein OIO90_004727 [Microbotryomycetes sp. JL221]
MYPNTRSPPPGNASYQQFLPQMASSMYPQHTMAPQQTMYSAAPPQAPSSVVSSVMPSQQQQQYPQTASSQSTLVNGLGQIPNQGVQGMNGAYAGMQGVMQIQQSAAQVADEEYNRLLKNYRLAHERIENQRVQMLEQEKQNATLRKHIALLEGGENGASVVGAHVAGGGGSTVDDFTIKNSSSTLERRINRWAADTLSSYARSAPPPPPGVDPSSFAHLTLIPLAEALFNDLDSIANSPFLMGLAQQGFDYPGLGIVVQSLLRHVMSLMLSDGIVNQLLVTNSADANQELTKLHEQLFNREPLVASVWRRQTFSAAVESLSPSMAISIFTEHMPSLFSVINPTETLSPALSEVLEASYTFSRMLHASNSQMGGGTIESGGFYRAYTPTIGSQLDPTQLELIKKCYRCERGEPERVGACLFPGLVKESALDNTPLPQSAAQASMLRVGPGGMGVGAASQQILKRKRETRRVVVRRAQVICECALAAAHSGTRRD